MPQEGFLLNSAHRFDICIDKANKDNETNWVRVGAGVSSLDTDNNEEVDQTVYFDGGGYGSSDVTGAQLILSFSGHRKYGDPAQDYVAGLLFKQGEDRKTYFRWTFPDGDKIEGEVTVANITPPSGDANAKQDFKFEIHFNGLPTYTEATGTTGTEG